MKRFNWKQNPEVIEFLKANCHNTPPSHLVDMLNEKFSININKAQLHGIMQREGLVTGFKKGNPHIRFLWTDEMLDFLRANVHRSREDTLKDLNEKFGTTFTIRALDGQKRKYNINQLDNGKFKLGQKNPYARKGYRLERRFPIGTEIVKTKSNTIWIKVADDYNVPQHHNWKVKARVIWEKNHGEIPKGYCICYKDGNPLNIDLSNLDCIPRRLAGTMSTLNLKWAGEFYETGKLVAESIIALKDIRENEKNNG